MSRPRLIRHNTVMLDRILDYLLAKCCACDFADVCVRLNIACSARQSLEAQLNAAPIVNRTRRGLYEHLWCVLGRQLVLDCRHSRVCLRDWIARRNPPGDGRQLAVYIINNSKALKLHVFHNKYVRRSTVYNLYNKASLQQAISAAGRSGLNAVSVYQEYAEAHADVQQLIHSADIFSLRDQLWAKLVIYPIPSHLLGASVFDVHTM